MVTDHRPPLLVETSTGLTVVTSRDGGFETAHLTSCPVAPSALAAMFEDLARTVSDKKLQPLSQTVFGAPELAAPGLAALEQAVGTIAWPVTWIDGGPSFVCTQMSAVRGVSVQTLELEERVVGTAYWDDDVRLCHVGGVSAPDSSAANAVQARATFRELEEVLQLVGMDFTDVVRTWLYIDDILNWYSDFNTVRWEFFENRGITKGRMPASTGIGVSNPARHAVVAACVAMRGARREVRAEAIPSPLQCPASDYRSSFSRAAEIKWGDRRRLFVSGTASIAPHGETAHVGDVAGQISLTMEVVEAILSSRGMNWRNVSRGIAYFKDLGDRPVFDSHCQEHGLSGLPLALTQGVICRDDLLFEIEVDAVA